MNIALPSTIPAYLAQLRRSLEGADPAMIQDALYDAEEYFAPNWPPTRARARPR